MNSLTLPLILAAQEPRWESIARGFKSRPMDARQTLLALAVLVGIAAALVLFSQLLHLLERRGSYDGPKRLFLALCRAHALSWGERWWLWRLARSQRLRDPARLFLEPERFLPANLPLGLRMHASRLAAIAERLFARAEPGDPGGPPPDGEDPAGPCPLRPPTASPRLEAPPWTS
jgi:hypothetical protein